MKQLLYPFVFCCMALLGLTACEDNSVVDLVEPNVVSNSIVLDFDSSSLPVSRATTEATGAEIKVEHLDVIIFASDDDTKVVHYERVSNLPEKNGKAVLSAKRSSFKENATYNVYVIANSTAPVATFQADKFNLNELKALIQTDRAIHLTGLEGATGVPTSFLMDGIAYSGDASNKAVVLYNGNKSENTELKVTLCRAAAKIVVNINKGEKVTFADNPTTYNAGYYLRNMPYSTSVISGVNGEAERRTPDRSSSNYFNWTENKVIVTAYAYAADWSGEGSSLLEEEVRLIVNIPLTYQETENSVSTFHENSYYQIPVSKTKMLNRNTCYVVNVTLNAPGGNNPSNPLKLEPMAYSVAPWTEKEISVGGESDRPAYLALNEYDMEMHNMAEDSTTLEFASSSAVTATIDEVYYFDKFGQKKNLTVRNGAEWGEKTTTGGRPSQTSWKNLCTIRITPDKNITGKIDVYGTIPENKTVRYIKFTVKNGEDIEREVTVAQYPLEYIINIQSWYSYRDDFKINNAKPTTFEYCGDRVYGISLATSSISNWDGKYNYQISRVGLFGDSNTTSGFFRSKVVTNVVNGKSTFKNYYWNTNEKLSTNQSNEYNGRLYHITLTATSSKYTLGIPRQIRDDISGLLVTDPGIDNAELVSPSFMIASSLSGFMARGGNLTMDDSSNSLRVAREHCAHYVEVAENGTVYDDWRLPTKAELEIILGFQGNNNEEADAIDYLLNGSYYYHAGGRVRNDNWTVDAGEVRCVRDVYNKKSGK